MQVIKYIFLILACLGLPALADEPPSWNNYIIQSENKEWTAVVQRKGNAAKPWEDAWELSVYKGFFESTPPKDIKPNWSSNYNPSGYSGGYLSNDGSTFSYLEFWYYPNRPVVEIYKEECVIRKNGSFFRVGENLQKTASHELWLEGSGQVKYSKSDQKLYLHIETVKGKRIVDTSCDEEV